MTRPTGFSSPFMLGFDEIERTLERIGKTSDGYPPYNIERLDGDGIRITLAVAGFDRADLDVILDERQLVIHGRQAEDDGHVYIHRGIAARQFQRTFLLAESMEVGRASLDRGLLVIELMRPEASRTARRIEIGAGPAAPARKE
ncbi:MAG TPA: Hsp20 family protein [Hyphomicrobiales bacterium]|nr:Hsp20 family protein [Hyphomicrobiales bacterium]